jgi:N-acyl-D-aspartate/D-glutamate deacylase
MGTRHDIVIRGGTVIDGRGGEPLTADVAIDGDVVTAVGRVAGGGHEEIDARGAIVTPGFVDIHTHYDGQAIWEEALAPSSQHGVTTVVMGNCGVGFAPCREEDRAAVVELMEGVEDIPEIVMTTGLSWDWESYPEYLDAIEARRHDINIASFLPHAPLRVHVMRERAVCGEPATAEDIERMAALTRDAMRAGAAGFATSRSIFHRSSSGGVIPTAEAEERELTAIAKEVRAAGTGLLQLVSDYRSMSDVDGEFGLIERVVAASGCTLTLPTVQFHAQPDGWREIVARIEQANAGGLRIKGQTMVRGIGMLMGLELSLHPFAASPSYRAVSGLPLTERVEAMRDPELRRRIIADAPADAANPLAAQGRNFGWMFEAGDPIDYEPDLSQSLAARAERAGIKPVELAYDILLGDGGRGLIYQPFANYAEGNLDVVGTMLAHEDFVVGLGDGGAHYGAICDASYSTFLLSHWTRDRKRGGRIGLERAIKALSHDNAVLMGFADRGVLAPGYRADVNVIDYDRLRLHAPRVVFDLPAGGRRLSQRADGYRATLVNGLITRRDGEATGALPGRLIRANRQAVPA